MSIFFTSSEDNKDQYVKGKFMKFFSSKKMALIAGLLMVVGVSLPASALLIDYEEISQVGNTYQYSYTFFNDGSADIDEVSIFYEVGLYDNLSIIGSPTDWDPLVYPVNDPPGAEGVADWFAFGAPLGAGDSLAGFDVQFDWLGASGGPGGQYFEAYDFNFDLLSSGSATNVNATVPEPDLLLLFSLGMVVLGFSRVSRKKLI